MSENFTKIVNPCHWDNHPTFCKITFENGNLSISGVVGPKRNGDAHGGCGQIIMSLKEFDDRGHSTLADLKPSEDWTAATLARFFQVWDAWHLNDMNPGCVHQRAEWDTREKVEVVSYKLTHDAYRQRQKLMEAAAVSTAKGELLTLDPTERALLGLVDWFQDRYTPPDADSPLSGCYEVSKRETKVVNWVYPHEHPKGISTKPCATCGYKYGSAWLKEEVPADVLDFLRGLPETKVTPAWV